MKKIVPRVASVDDAEAIARMHTRTWQVAYRGQMPDAFLDGLSIEARTAKWRSNLASGDGATVVIEDGPDHVIGFCSLLPARDPDLAPTIGELAALYIDPTRARTGLGRLLMHDAFDRAHRCGYTALTLWVLETNRNARAFYETLGFEPDGTVRNEEWGNLSVRGVRYRKTLA